MSERHLIEVRAVSSRVPSPAPRRMAPARALAALLAVTSGACTGSTSPAGPSASTTPPAGQGVAVRVDPGPQNVPLGATAQFAAVVTGTANAAVLWSVREPGGGSITSTGLYTASGGAGDFHVRATSVADPNAFGEALVTVPAPPPGVSVTVVPASAPVDACRTLQLSATVANATNGAVTWTIDEGAAGGSVSASGLYTAPAVAGVYHVRASSVQDPSRQGVTIVTVSEKVLSVSVSPGSISLAPGATATFTATVTTTCGAFASTSTVTAP